MIKILMTVCIARYKFVRYICFIALNCCIHLIIYQDILFLPAVHTDTVIAVTSFIKFISLIVKRLFT